MNSGRTRTKSRRPRAPLEVPLGRVNQRAEVARPWALGLGLGACFARGHLTAHAQGKNASQFSATWNYLERRYRLPSYRLPFDVSTFSFFTQTTLYDSPQA
eukprot:2964102-Prymnesium_polylepis.1